MTKEKIIAMANQAKLPYNWFTGELMWLDKLEQFAKLIAEHEREECAKICKNFDLPILVEAILERGQE
jgi:hypothetical protein